VCMFLQTGEREDVQVSTKFAVGEVVCICPGAVVWERGPLTSSSSHRFDLCSSSEVVTLVDGAEPRLVSLGEQLRDFDSSTGRFEIQGHVVKVDQDGSFIVKPVPRATNSFYFDEDEAMLREVLALFFSFVCQQSNT
jgi:hypothetical protein